MKIVLGISWRLAIFLLTPIWSGFVITILWRWFIVSFFHLSPLSIALAIGISLITRMLTYQMPEKQDTGKGNTGYALVFSLLYPLLLLGMGFVVHLFV